jgi:hypothetical protein
MLSQKLLEGAKVIHFLWSQFDICIYGSLFRVCCRDTNYWRFFISTYNLQNVVLCYTFIVLTYSLISSLYLHLIHLISFFIVNLMRQMELAANCSFVRIAQCIHESAACIKVFCCCDFRVWMASAYNEWTVFSSDCQGRTIYIVYPHHWIFLTAASCASCHLSVFFKCKYWIS